MKPIKFTQYLRPDGRAKEMLIDRPDEIANKAQAFIDQGGRFDIEMLMTGDVSITAEITDHEGEVKTIAQEIVPNGLEVPIAVDRLVQATHQ